MFWRKAWGPIRTFLLQSQRSPNCLSESAHIACISGVQCLIALTFRNLTCKKIAISGKPGGVDWDGTKSRPQFPPPRGHPSLPGIIRPAHSSCPASFTYTFGLCSGNSIDSPSLSRRTVARNNRPAHNGVPLPGAGWRDTEVPQKTL